MDDSVYPRKNIDPQKYNSGSINVEIDEMKYYLLKTIPKRLLSYSSIEETNQLIFEIYELIGKTELIKRIDENIANMSTDFNINIYDEPEIYGSNANLKRNLK
jgi:hypothetical protein